MKGGDKNIDQGSFLLSCDCMKMKLI